VEEEEEEEGEEDQLAAPCALLQGWIAPVGWIAPAQGTAWGNRAHAVLSEPLFPLIT
jgi:hypothetical protein